ncbi:MAG: hypothetical protein HYV27_17310 [Candidatus Hydrogenedentes bacterium]|nr:hypothetical protein [Candidatus Hydrogenedentota bacterium]
MKVCIPDTCVLLDYWKTSPDILRALHQHVERVVVLDTVFDQEIADPSMSRQELLACGISFHEPPHAILLEASRLSESGSLSFYDWVIVLATQDLQAVCITNDRRLREACRQRGVERIWGLEMLLHLTSAGRCTCEESAAWALCMHALNPGYINETVLASFLAKLRP